MLLTTLFLSFTGYLLPWDQLAYWAMTVGTNIASPLRWLANIRTYCRRSAIEQRRLIRFYVLHCFFFPLGVLGCCFSTTCGACARTEAWPASIVERRCEQKKRQGGTQQKQNLLAAGNRPWHLGHVETTLIDDDPHIVNASPELPGARRPSPSARLRWLQLLAVAFRAPLESAAEPA